MADRGADQLNTRHVGQPRDVGRTMGGGSLGHVQPTDVADEIDNRNRQQAPEEKERGESDPVMPKNDATLKTKI